MTMTTQLCEISGSSTFPVPSEQVKTSFYISMPCPKAVPVSHGFLQRPGGRSPRAFRKGRGTTRDHQSGHEHRQGAAWRLLDVCLGSSRLINGCLENTKWTPAGVACKFMLVSLSRCCYSFTKSHHVSSLLHVGSWHRFYMFLSSGT